MLLTFLPNDSIERQDTHQDSNEEGSYFDRPVTRSKPRRPVSRQVRLNKRVHNWRDEGLDSESYREELGEWDPPPKAKEKVNSYNIQKVIPNTK